MRKFIPVEEAFARWDKDPEFRKEYEALDVEFILYELLLDDTGPAEDALHRLIERRAIGILPIEKFRARSMSIVQGEYTPQPNDPKLWFSSEQAALDAVRQLLDARR